MVAVQLLFLRTINVCTKSNDIFDVRQSSDMFLRPFSWGVHAVLDDKWSNHNHKLSKTNAWFFIDWLERVLYTSLAFFISKIPEVNEFLSIKHCSGCELLYMEDMDFTDSSNWCHLCWKQMCVQLWALVLSSWVFSLKPDGPWGPPEVPEAKSKNQARCFPSLAGQGGSSNNNNMCLGSHSALVALWETLRANVVEKQY